MASTHVYTETKNLLQGQFSAGYSLLDFDEIDSVVMKAGDTPFMAIEEVTDDEALSAFGNPQGLCQRQQGVIVVHAFVPAPTTAAFAVPPGGPPRPSSFIAREVIEQVQAFMRYQQYANIRIVSVTPPDVELLNNGLWTAAAVAISYVYDFKVAMP